MYAQTKGGMKWTLLSLLSAVLVLLMMCDMFEEMNHFAFVSLSIEARRWLSSFSSPQISESQ